MYQNRLLFRQQQCQNATGPSLDEMLRIEDWTIPEGNISLDSSQQSSMPMMFEHSAPAYQTSTDCQSIIRPKAEPSSSLDYDYSAPSAVFYDTLAPPVYSSQSSANANYTVKENQLASPDHLKVEECDEPEDRSSSVGPMRRRRGRPMKSVIDGSHSKQAMYAREYRTKNKQLLEEYRQQVADLAERNRSLEEIQTRNSDLYQRLQEEFERLQDDNLRLQSEIVPAVTQLLKSDNHSTSKLSIKSGVCIHLSQQGISLKSCDHCKSVSGSSSPHSCRESSTSFLPFDGDFSFVERYLC